VDDFFVKYTTEESAQHLLTTLQEDYELTADWTGSRYLGMTLDWDYLARTCDVSMPGYVKRALDRFAHPAPDRPQHAPFPWTPPQYGAKVQMAENEDISPALGKEDTTRLQEIIGVLLFYARMIDNTMLVALGDLASAQANGTQATMNAAIHLLNYAATHPEATIRYKASDMVLHIVSDASYLSAPKARSRLAGYFFLSSNMETTPADLEMPPPFNAPILINAKIIKTVVSSAAEAELGALFYNAQDGCTLRTSLEDLGHVQPATLIETDNSCAAGIANQTIKRKRSKAMDMKFYWIVDRVTQGQYRIKWRPGKGESKATPNAADYHSKHHSPAHHRLMRSRYLHEPSRSLPDEDSPQRAPIPTTSQNTLIRNFDTAQKYENEQDSDQSRATVPTVPFPYNDFKTPLQSPLHLGSRRVTASDSPLLVIHDIRKA
jgi:hypothetical protein